MKDEIESVMSALIGLPLAERYRTVDMEGFQFGNDLASGYALHVQCPWRIERAGQLVVGYRDMRDPPDGVSVEGWDPNDAHVTRRDELLRGFIDERRAHPRLVVDVEATNAGDVRLILDDGSELRIFPDSVAVDDEYWRLLKGPPRGDHYVVGGDGFDHRPAGRSAPAVVRRGVASGDIGAR